MKVAAPFSAADELEFRKQDLAGALLNLKEAAHNQDSAIRGEALLRMARIHRKLGETALALKDFGTALRNSGTQRRITFIGKLTW